MMRLKEALRKQAALRGEARQFYTPALGQPVRIPHKAERSAKARPRAVIMSWSFAVGPVLHLPTLVKASGIEGCPRIAVSRGELHCTYEHTAKEFSPVLIACDAGFTSVVLYHFMQP